MVVFSCVKFTCEYVNTLHYPIKQIIFFKSVTLGVQPSPSPLKTVLSEGSIFRSAEHLLHIQLAWHAFENVPLSGNAIIKKSYSINLVKTELYVHWGV